jgi:serine/threonine-protein kinase HipA
MSTKQSGRPDTLSVKLNSRLVGTLTRFPDDTVVFAFDPTYTQDPKRPILSLSFKSEGGGLSIGKSRSGPWLLPFFSNLLPEGHLRDYLAKKLNVNPEREFFLLSGLGMDLPGAVIVEPMGEITPVLNESNVLDTKPESQILRFSLAGVQLKFSAIAEATGGFTVPANGAGGSWIIKLPSERHLQVPETEYSMLMLAGKIGIEIPELKLIPTTSVEGLPDEFRASVADSLAVRRFDRTNSGGRIHMEDFAQVYGVYPKDKYEKAGYGHIARVLWIDCGEPSYTEFIRRLVFTVAIGNGDMHLKNWSLLYIDPLHPVLSPAYDFVPTIAYMGDKETLGLNLGGTKDFDDVTVHKFKKIAAQAKASEKATAQIVKETTEAIQESWSKYRFELRIPEDVRKAIDSHMSRMLLFKASPSIPQLDLSQFDRLKNEKPLVIKDLEYDPNVPEKTLILEAYTGYSTAVSAPERMEPSLIESVARQGLLPELFDGPVRVFVGAELYRQWRRIRFITLDFAGLATSTESSNWNGDRGVLTGRFPSEVWQRIVSAHQRKSLEEFDMMLPEGAIRTFKARVSKIDDIHRNEGSDETEATAVLSLYDSKIILRRQEGISYLLSPFSFEEVMAALGAALHEHHWETSLFSEQFRVVARKNVRAILDKKEVDVPLEAEIVFQTDQHKTDLCIRVTDKDGRYSSKVNWEARQIRQQVLAHLPVEAN